MVLFIRRLIRLRVFCIIIISIILSSSSSSSSSGSSSSVKSERRRADICYEFGRKEMHTGFWWRNPTKVLF
jgi:hypothetical protein